MADNVKNWGIWNLDNLDWAPEAADPKLAIAQGNEWVLTVTDRVPDIVTGVINSNWTSNILPEWLILKPRTFNEILSNIHILYKEDYSDNLIFIVKSTYKKLNMHFSAAMSSRTSSFLFDYFENNKENLKMLSEIYNDKYKEIFLESSSGLNICFDLEQILTPNYFENQEQSRIKRLEMSALQKELETLVWLTEVLWKYLNNPNMLYELYAKMEEDWKLTDRESEFIRNRLNSSWILIYKVALFYMLCIEYREKEVTRRVKEWIMSSNEQEQIMRAIPTKAVKVLYDMIKSEETNS